MSLFIVIMVAMSGYAGASVCKPLAPDFEIYVSGVQIIAGAESWSTRKTASVLFLSNDESLKSGAYFRGVRRFIGHTACNNRNDEAMFVYIDARNPRFGVFVPRDDELSNISKSVTHRIIPECDHLLAEQGVVLEQFKKLNVRFDANSWGSTYVPVLKLNGYEEFVVLVAKTDGVDFLHLSGHPGPVNHLQLQLSCTGSDMGGDSSPNGCREGKKQQAVRSVSYEGLASRQIGKMRCSFRHLALGTDVRFIFIFWAIAVWFVFTGIWIAVASRPHRWFLGAFLVLCGIPIMFIPVAAKQLVANNGDGDCHQQYGNSKS